MEITGHLEVNSWLPDGVDHIRVALSNAEQSEFEDVEIQVIMNYCISHSNCTSHIIDIRVNNG